MAGALDGVRILDLSWGIAGPLGVLLLAEQGADVIKVEPPGGDPFRGYERLRGRGTARAGRSPSTSSTPTGRDAFPRLADDADVLVETFRPGVTDRLGIGYDGCTRATRASSTARARRTPTATASRDRPGLRRARRRRQRPAVGAARLAPRADLPAHADAEHGRDVPRADRHPRRAHRARGRPGAASTCATSLFQGALLYTTQIWTSRRRPAGSTT